MNIQFLALLISLLLNYYHFTLIDQNSIPIFQPIPSATVYPLSDCREGQTSSIQPFQFKQSKCVALSVGTCGLYIFDITYLNNVNLIYQNRLNSLGQALGLAVSHDSSYLWVTYSTGQFFSIDIKDNFKTVFQGVSSANSAIYNIIPWGKNNFILLLLCQSSIQIKEWNQEQSTQYNLQVINTNAFQTKDLVLVRQNQFAVVSTSNQGLQFYKLTNGNNVFNIIFNFSCQLSPFNEELMDFKIIDDNTIALLFANIGLTIYSAENYFNNLGSVCNSNSFSLLDQTPPQGQGGHLYFSNDKKYLYSQFRAVGVKIYDVTSRKLQLVQSIKVDQNSKDIILNDQEDLLFYSNSATLVIFERSQPNFNKDMPNLLLNYFQIQTYKWFKENSKIGSFDLSCSLQQNSLFLARSDYGVSVFKYSGEGVLEDYSYLFRAQNKDIVSNLAFLQDGFTAYISRKQTGFTIISFAIPSSPIILKQGVDLSYPQINFTNLGFFKNFSMGIVANQINALIFSISDPLNPYLITVIETQSHTNGNTSVSNFHFSQDESKVFLCLTTYGILIYDVQNPKIPNFIFAFFTDGSKDILQIIKKSQLNLFFQLIFNQFNNRLIQNEKYALISTIYSGIIITQINFDFSLNEISRIDLRGTINKMIMIVKDQYILVTTSVLPSVSLISITDLNNPLIIQKLGFQKDFGYFDLCPSQDKSEVFVTGVFQLMLLQTQSQITLQTQFYELIKQSNLILQQQRITLPKDSILKVGQQIELHVFPVYQQDEIQIRKVFYYQDYILKDLPNWMSFSSKDSILSLSISKECLEKNNSGQYITTLQQIVFLCYNTIQDVAFINTYLDITQTDSVSLYNNCVDIGLIDQFGFIEDSYIPTKPLNFGVNESLYLAKWSGQKQNLVKQFIQHILNKYIINYPIQFSVQDSLTVNLSNKNQPILSIQNEIQINLSFIEEQQNGEYMLSSKIKFVDQKFSGVQTLLSKLNNEIKLIGPQKEINKILSDGIKYMIYPQNQNGDILVKMQVIDFVNHDYEQVFPYQNFDFIKEQQPIKLSETDSIQSELNQKYQNGEIFILENFQYQISRDIFQSLTELKYSAQIKLDGEFQEIPNEYWMQFYSQDRIFSGVPQLSNFNELIEIQVNATDGYSQLSENFQIIPNKVPFNYIIALAVEILLPILTFLLLYKYKHIFYNLCFKNKYIYSKDVAYVGEIYRKQIIITDKISPVAHQLWKFFLNQVGEDKIKYIVKDKLNRHDLITNQRFYNFQPENKTEQKYQEKQKQQLLSIIPEKNLNQFQEEVLKKMYPFGINSDDFRIVGKKHQNMYIQNSVGLYEEDSKEGKSLIQNQKAINNNLLHKEASFIEFSNKTDNLNDRSITKSLNRSATRQSEGIESPYVLRKQFKSVIQNIKNSVIVKNINQNLEQENNAEQQQALLIFKKDGKLNFQYVLNLLIEKQAIITENLKIASQMDIKKLRNPNSVLSQAIFCLFVEYLLNIDSTTKHIFECLKILSLNYYKEIDWYKAYINLIPQFQDVNNNPFPQIQICESVISAALTEIFKNVANNQKEQVNNNQINNIIFSKILIEENLKAKAIGFSIQKPTFLQSTIGESIHSYQHMIKSVKAFERNTSIRCCWSFYKKLDLHYKKKGLIDNERLPSWIKGVDLINGVILFGGIPEKKDIGSLLIKIFDQDSYILRCFEVQIIQKQSQLMHFKSQVFEKQPSLSFNLENHDQETAPHIHQSQYLESFNKFMNYTKSVDTYSPKAFKGKINNTKPFQLTKQSSLSPLKQSVTESIEEKDEVIEKLCQTQRNVRQNSLENLIISPTETPQNLPISPQFLPQSPKFQSHIQNSIQLDIELPQNSMQAAQMIEPRSQQFTLVTAQQQQTYEDAIEARDNQYLDGSANSLHNTRRIQYRGKIDKPTQDIDSISSIND